MNDYDVDDANLPPLSPPRKRTNEGGSAAVSRKPAGKGPRSGVEVPPMGKEDKPRPPRPKLNHERLLRGGRGFKYLRMNAAKTLRLSGKAGHETADLSQIVTFLHEWSKQVFPKMQLLDFLHRVEDLCQTKLMKLYLNELMARTDDANVDFDELFLIERAAEEANAAMRTSSLPADIKPVTSTDNVAFDELEDLLSRQQPRERPEHTDDESDADSETDDDDDAMKEEMRDFINDEESSEADADGSDGESDASGSGSEREESDADNGVQASQTTAERRGGKKQVMLSDSDGDVDTDKMDDSVMSDVRTQSSAKRNIRVIDDDDDDE